MKNTWNKTLEKPLVDWNEDHTEWVESNHCPRGAFLAGFYGVDGEFEWFRVMLTEQGLVELGDDNEFPMSDYGIAIDEFEYWMEIEKP